MEHQRRHQPEEVFDNIRCVGTAERLVTGAVAESTTADEGRRAQILKGLLNHLADTETLAALCRELRMTGRYAEYAYRHNNGFFVLFLTDPEIGVQSRLHLWLPGRTSPERPHRHRMAFASRVLAGELTSVHFERCEVNGAPAPTDALYEETVISAPARTNFDAPDAEFQPQRTVILRELSRSCYRAGDIYFFPAAGIHRVETPIALTAPNMTLTVWGVPFQDSIAYEPCGSMTAVMRKSVQRLSTSTFGELLDIVLEHLRPSRQVGSG